MESAVRDGGVENLIVTSRTFDHAVALARTVGGTAVQSRCVSRDDLLKVK